MVLELMARNSYLAKNGKNSTLQCLFSEEKGALSSSFDIKWMVLPNILNAISIVTLGIGGIEFICAQTPYSMKGLMVGTVYGMQCGDNCTHWIRNYRAFHQEHDHLEHWHD